jgi:hypothetical protein
MRRQERSRAVKPSRLACSVAQQSQERCDTNELRRSRRSPLATRLIRCRAIHSGRICDERTARGFVLTFGSVRTDQASVWKLGLLQLILNLSQRDEHGRNCFFESQRLR